MFERKISKETAISVVQTGEIIAEYPDDKPYPSYLIFAKINGRPIHVLTAFNKTEKMCYVITVYEPHLKIWQKNYKTRRKP